MAINDGHRSEQVMIEMLRAVKGVELFTQEGADMEAQIAFELVDGHFVGKLDGVIVGILQAPKTPHVWEAKAVNQKKFDKLVALVAKVGEKNALQQWDEKYFAQAQSYMHGMDLTRHYLTVATPGVRDMIGVRTEYQVDVALKYVARAKRIVYDDTAPARISNDPAFFGCKFCDHAGSCHGQMLPQVNCRTCAFATATDKGGGNWTCTKFGVDIDHDVQQRACQKHRYHPDMINGKPALIDDNGDHHYDMLGGRTYVDGDKINRPQDPMVTSG